jgi:hypothetical protein
MLERALEELTKSESEGGVMVERGDTFIEDGSKSYYGELANRDRRRKTADADQAVVDFCGGDGRGDKLNSFVLPSSTYSHVIIL